MKVQSRQYRWGMQLAAGLFVFVVLWAGRELFRTGEMQRAVAARRAVGHTLASMEQESQDLAQLSDAWAVSGAMSEEIRVMLSGADSQVAFPAPRLLGAQRLHTAAFTIEQGALAALLESLDAVQGFPVRVLQLELTVDDASRESGAMVLGWLEAL